MRIGLLSDTHSYLDDRILDYFRQCDEIWHAGDIGDSKLLDTLQAYKPVRAVFGNIDSKDLQVRLVEDLRFSCEGLDVLITHIGGTPPRYNPRVRRMLKQHPPDLFICGHSHILRIKRDPDLNNMLYLNPGAAGQQGFHVMRTIVRFSVQDQQIQDLEVIDLGKRGQTTADG